MSSTSSSPTSSSSSIPFPSRRSGSIRRPQGGRSASPAPTCDFSVLERPSTPEFSAYSSRGSSPNALKHILKMFSSTPGRKGKSKAVASSYSNWEDMVPLDGDEGEYIDFDEACFVDIRTVTGIGMFNYRYVLSRSLLMLRRKISLRNYQPNWGYTLSHHFSDFQRFYPASASHGNGELSHKIMQCGEHYSTLPVGRSMLTEPRLVDGRPQTTGSRRPDRSFRIGRLCSGRDTPSQNGGQLHRLSPSIRLPYGSSVAIQTAYIASNSTLRESSQDQEINLLKCGV